MDYIRVAISTTSEGVEAVIGALDALGIEQLEILEDEETIRGYLEELSAQWDYCDPRALMIADEPCVRVYLPIEEDAERHLRMAEEIRVRMDWLRGQDFGLDLGTLRVATDIVRAEDWENNWKQYYKPTRIGQSIVVKPSWEEYAVQPNDRVITLDPGMAFGTGTHETTSLCLEAVERYLSPGDRVLDIGCGSGILSIAAALCGASSVDAIDIDPIAVRVATENVERNGLCDVVRCREGDLLANQRDSAHVTLANIVADVILRLMPAAFAHTLPDGTFIASGIIDEREDEIVESAVAHGFTHVETLKKGIWRAIVFKKA